MIYRQLRQQASKAVPREKKKGGPSAWQRRPAQSDQIIDVAGPSRTIAAEGRVESLEAFDKVFKVVRGRCCCGGGV